MISYLPWKAFLSVFFKIYFSPCLQPSWRCCAPEAAFKEDHVEKVCTCVNGHVMTEVISTVWCDQFGVQNLKSKVFELRKKENKKMRGKPFNPVQDCICGYALRKAHMCSNPYLRNTEGWDISGSGWGTIFSCDVSDLCADQRWRVRGYKVVYHMAQVFHLLLCSYHSRFVETISTLFCHVNIKLVLFFVD